MKKFFLMSIIALIIVAGITATHAQTAAQKKANDQTPKSSASANNAQDNVDANDKTSTPKTAEEFRSLGQSRYETNKFKEAVDAFKKSLRLDPNEARTHYHLGLAYAALTSYADAAGSFKRATILQPAWPEPHFRLGWMYYVLGKREQSLQEARVLNELDPRLASKLDKILNVNTGADSANKATTKPAQPKTAQANTDATKSADHTQQPNSTSPTTKAVNKTPTTSTPGNALVEKANSSASPNTVNPSFPNNTASTSSAPVNNAPTNSANSNTVATSSTTNAATTSAQGSAVPNAPSADSNATTSQPTTGNPTAMSAPSATNTTNSPATSNAANTASNTASAPASNAPASNTTASNATTSSAAVSSPSTTTSPAATPVKAETVPSVPSSAITDEASLPNIYRVGVGDVLDIRLINTPTNRSTLFTVLDGGLIEYPLAGGSVQVAGLTTEEIVARLTAELTQRSALSEKSQVAVGVREYASHTIIVGGLVNYSGARVLRREAVPLYVVLAEAQPRTEAGRAVIMRATGQKIIDLADPAAMSMLVRPGDVINLSARVQQFYFIGGQVPAPGQKVFQPGLTLLQAILAAGGSIKPEDNIVELSREGGGGRLTTNKLQLKDIKSGKVPDPRLQPGDRIDVSH